MKLIIGRHGDAEPTSPTGLDRDRSLTEKGKSDIEKMGEFIFKSSLKVSHIFHSPYKRTTETAEIFAKNLQFDRTPMPADELLPSNDYTEIFPQLSKFTNSDTILLIGHNPDVSYFAARLIRDVSISRSFVFSTGTTIAINIPKENFSFGQLIWMISPDFLKS